MPKCANGHDSGPRLTCATCGSPVLFDAACEDMCKLPELNPYFGAAAAVSVGLPTIEASGVNSFSITLGGDTRMAVDSLTLKKLEGGTWLDYYSSYMRVVVKWLRLIGFSRAQSRLLVADTSNPISVLAMASPSIEEGTLVFGVVADPDSTPIDRNISYVALQVAARKKLPILMAGGRYVDELACFVEDEGLLVGPQAMERLLFFSLNFAGDLLDFIKKDIKLGVNHHVFSALMAASSEVYKNVEDALAVSGEMVSVDLKPEDVQMAYLLASSKKELQEELKAAFDKHCRGFPGLVNSDIRFLERSSRYGFYDTFTLYGIREIPSLTKIREGYDTIVGRAGNLRVEEII